MVDRERRIVDTLVDLVNALMSGLEAGAILTLVCERAATILDVDAVGMIVRDDETPLVAASNERALEVLQVAAALGTGPLAVADQEEIGIEYDIEAGDLPSEVAAAARRAGVRFVQCVPLRSLGGPGGAICVFRDERGVIAQSDLLLVEAVGEIASASILRDRDARSASDVARQLQEALDSRVLIEQAKGIIAERANVDVDEAFRRLRKYARDHNMRLAALASSIVSRPRELAPDIDAALFS